MGVLATREKYERIFCDWIGRGNRILKTKRMTFIFTYYNYRGVSGIGYYDNKNGFKFTLLWMSVMGEVISKKKIPFFLNSDLKKMMKPISKKEFIRELIDSDSTFHNIEVNNRGSDRFIFSFDTVGMGLLPDWITAELVAKKLEG